MSPKSLSPDKSLILVSQSSTAIFNVHHDCNHIIIASFYSNSSHVGKRYSGEDRQTIVRPYYALVQCPGIERAQTPHFTYCDRSLGVIVLPSV